MSEMPLQTETEPAPLALGYEARPGVQLGFGYLGRAKRLWRQRLGFLEVISTPPAEESRVRQFHEG